jgi:hypothetical protein
MLLILFKVRGLAHLAAAAKPVASASGGKKEKEKEKEREGAAAKQNAPHHAAAGGGGGGAVHGMPSHVTGKKADAVSDNAWTAAGAGAGRIFYLAGDCAYGWRVTFAAGQIEGAAPLLSIDQGLIR